MAARWKSIPYFTPKLCATPIGKKPCHLHHWLNGHLRGLAQALQVRQGMAHLSTVVRWRCPWRILCSCYVTKWHVGNIFVLSTTYEARWDAGQVCETPCSRLPLATPSSNSSAASPQVLLRVQYEPESRKCNPANGWGETASGPMRRTRPLKACKHVEAYVQAQEYAQAFIPHT